MVKGCASLKDPVSEPTPLHSCDGARRRFENARKRSGLDRIVMGNEFVMLTIVLGCHPRMRSLLPTHI